MGTIAHFKDLYTTAFENCKPSILVTILKVYTVFSGLMLVMACYAFMYRVFNGFDF